MQPPAETPGFCTPGHSVLSAASGTLTPFAPFLESFFSIWGFMNLAGGRTPSADATAAIASASVHASASTTLGLMRIDPPSGTRWGALPRAPAVVHEVSDGSDGQTGTF